MLAGDAGAALVADIVPGPISSNPSDLATVNETLFFAASDSAGSRGLWASDGTAAGTKLVKSGLTGAAEFTSFNGEVYFTSNGLWKTDGTEAGTSQLIGMAASSLTAVGNTLYFAGDRWGRGSKGVELWKSDGTAAGTTLVKDIDSGTSKDGGRDCRRNCSVPNSSLPQWLVDLNGTLLFTAANAKNGRELWVSDGTSKGTRLVKDIVAGGGSSNPQHLRQFDGQVYFGAEGGLWRTDGTKGGTVLVKALADSPSYLTSSGGALYFTAGATGSQLWKSDGTAAGTVVVEDLGFGPEHLTNVNGRLYFTGNDGAHGEELWQHDTVTGETNLVMDIYPGSEGSSPAYLAEMHNKLYFVATDSVHGRELWDPPPVEPPPATELLLTTSWDTNSVKAYDRDTGAYVRDFVSPRSGGLNQPWSLIVGPHDDNLYVASGHFGQPGRFNGVLRFDGTTGEFIDEFVDESQIAEPHAVLFGPNGDFYVGDRTPSGQARIVRYDGLTGATIGDFVPPGTGGMGHPRAMVFAPSGKNPNRFDLFVSDGPTRSVLRFDGETGEFLGRFVDGDTLGLIHPAGLTFGPDGNLYLADESSVFRFQGPRGSSPGKLMDEFVPPGSGGLIQPFGVLFGPDRNGDGHQDFYVNSQEFLPSLGARRGTSSVKLYDGVTGAFIETFVGEGSGGLDGNSLMAFTKTDPVTLVYPADNLRAPSMAETATDEFLTSAQVQPLLLAALSRLDNSSFDTTHLRGIQSRIADLPGATLGRASNDTIWLDSDGAGWGWFIDPTAGDDTEFLMSGDQGEQNRLDLLSAISHELGHLLEDTDSFDLLPVLT